MARLGTMLVHNTKKVSIQESSRNGVNWIDIDFDDTRISVFDITKEDLRGAIYRSDMEEYDAD